MANATITETKLGFCYVSLASATVTVAMKAVQARGSGQDRATQEQRLQMKAQLFAQQMVGRLH